MDLRSVTLPYHVRKPATQLGIPHPRIRNQVRFGHHRLSDWHRPFSNGLVEDQRMSRVLDGTKRVLVGKV